VKFLLRLVIYPLIGLIALVGALLGFSGFYLSPQDKLEKADAIVAISGGETRARVVEAARLYKDEWAPQVIFSGAAREGNVSNALSMARIAATLDVPLQAITLEEESETTAENAREVAKIVKREGYDKVILVTSPYHQRRAELEFRKALPDEVKLINHSATDSTWRRSGWWKTDEGRGLTFSELSKVAYIVVTGKSGSSAG
jgi:uncharacterized SAM-binding protein YcdF (DUF218 family)